MYNGNSQRNLIAALRQMPSAMAILQGSEYYPEIKGDVKFYQMQDGVLVITEVYGLPRSLGYCDQPIFAFYIHEGASCSNEGTESFVNTGTHYNPYSCPHPYHAGDMPPLFGSDGSAFSAFLTNRFAVNDIIGRTVIIHDMPDDFMTQPSGNAGSKIACGEIKSVQRSRVR